MFSKDIGVLIVNHQIKKIYVEIFLKSILMKNFQRNVPSG